MRPAVEEARDALMEVAKNRCEACRAGWIFDGARHIAPPNSVPGPASARPECKAFSLRRIVDRLEREED